MCRERSSFLDIGSQPMLKIHLDNGSNLDTDVFFLIFYILTHDHEFNISLSCNFNQFKHAIHKWKKDKDNVYANQDVVNKYFWHQLLSGLM